MTLDELDETAALARGNLDIGDFTKALEERAELVLGDVARETTNKDRGVVGVGELVHRLRRTVEAHGGTAHRRVHTRGTGHAHATGHHTGALVLGRRGGDAHGTVAAVDALHLAQSTLLVALVGEADEAVAARHAADGIGHDLGGLARREATLEQRDQNVLVDLGTQVTNEDGELGTTVIAAGKLVDVGRGESKSYLRSARPPPVAQFSLKTRLVLGMGVPFRERALEAAGGDAKSTKQ